MGAFPTTCRLCGEPIELREIAPGRWRPFERHNVRHRCPQWQGWQSKSAE